MRSLTRPGRSGVVIAASLILAACTEAQLAPPATSPAASTSSVPAPRTLSIGEAAILIRKTVTRSSPVLLPRAIPAGFTATVTVSVDDFQVTYASVDSARHIFFELGLAQPGPQQSDGVQLQLGFRGVIALYQV